MNQDEYQGYFGEAISALRDYSVALITKPASNVIPVVIEHRSPKMAARIAATFFQCYNLFSEAGDFARIIMINEGDCDAQMTWDLRRIFSSLAYDPVLFKDKSIWLFNQALMQMQVEFSTTLCPSPSKEETLTGKLLSALSSACSEWQKRGADVLRETGDTLELKEVDLQVLNGESKTGGDFALVLEFGRDGQRKFVPVIFQAKRFIGRKADISRKHETRGYQYDVFRKQVCTTAYVFYENGTAKTFPCSPPIVKITSGIRHPLYEPSTDPFVGSIDFATFVISLINGVDENAAAGDESEALAMILADADLDRLQSIAVVSSRGEIELRYARALQELLKNGSAHAVDDSPSSETDSTPRPF